MSLATQQTYEELFTSFGQWEPSKVSTEAFYSYTFALYQVRDLIRFDTNYNKISIQPIIPPQLVSTEPRTQVVICIFHLYFALRQETYTTTKNHRGPFKDVTTRASFIICHISIQGWGSCHSGGSDWLWFQAPEVNSDKAVDNKWPSHKNSISKHLKGRFEGTCKPCPVRCFFNPVPLDPQLKVYSGRKPPTIYGPGVYYGRPV